MLFAVFVALLLPTLSIAQCFSAGYQACASGLCAQVSNMDTDFVQADLTCQSQSAGGHLVSIHSAFDNACLRSFALSIPGITYAYIGLIDALQNRIFTWIDGSAVDYLNWCADMPSGSNVDDCVVMNVNTSGCWISVPCDRQSKPLCGQGPISEQTCGNNNMTGNGCPDRWVRYQEFCYRNFDLFGNWNHANDFCVNEQDANLVSIRDQSENQFIMGLLKKDYEGQVNGSYPEGWIGMRINGGWSDGTSVNYTNYMPVAPVGNCVIMVPCANGSVERNGEWFGDQCATKYRQAICKKRASG